MATATGYPVTEAVYQVEGKGDLGKPVDFDATANCGNCHRRTTVARAATVLTSRFGSWDDIVPDPNGGRWLCFPCAWCYRTPELRRTPVLVTQTPTVERPDATTLLSVLARPIPTDTTVIVPVNGKRIVAPRARWGSLTSDRGPTTWRGRHYQMLTAVNRLHDLGIWEKSLADPAPPWAALEALNTERHAEVRQLWALLKPARDDKTLLPLLQTLGRNTR